MVSSVQKLGVAMDFASGSNSADALVGMWLRLEGKSVMILSCAGAERFERKTEA